MFASIWLYLAIIIMAIQVHDDDERYSEIADKVEERSKGYSRILSQTIDSKEQQIRRIRRSRPARELRDPAVKAGIEKLEFEIRDLRKQAGALRNGSQLEFGILMKPLQVGDFGNLDYNLTNFANTQGVGYMKTMHNRVLFKTIGSEGELELILLGAPRLPESFPNYSMDGGLLEREFQLRLRGPYEVVAITNREAARAIIEDPKTKLEPIYVLRPLDTRRVIEELRSRRADEN